MAVRDGKTAKRPHVADLNASGGLGRTAAPLSALRQLLASPSQTPYSLGLPPLAMEQEPRDDGRIVSINLRDESRESVQVVRDRFRKKRLGAAQTEVLPGLMHMLGQRLSAKREKYKIGRNQFDWDAVEALRGSLEKYLGRKADTRAEWQKDDPDLHEVYEILDWLQNKVTEPSGRSHIQSVPPYNPGQGFTSQAQNAAYAANMPNTAYTPPYYPYHQFYYGNSSHGYGNSSHGYYGKSSHSYYYIPSSGQAPSSPFIPTVSAPRTHAPNYNPRHGGLEDPNHQRKVPKASTRQSHDDHGEPTSGGPAWTFEADPRQGPSPRPKEWRRKPESTCRR